ncbi:MAG: ATP-dependent zinc metalloprotease FtsH [Defluviitaleaceae bacterium]|nr:ATP-dependent zinc metalloprotease FtsH [Defluviitaleaceae bacterium]
MNENSPNQKKDDKNTPPGSGFNIFHFLLIGLVLTVIINVFTNNLSQGTRHNIRYDQFLNLLDTNSVSSVEISPTRLTISLRDNLDEETVENVVNILENINIQAHHISDSPAIQQELPVSNSFIEQARVNFFNRPTFIGANNANRTFYTGNLHDPNLVDRLIYSGVEYFSPIIETNVMMEIIISWVLPLAFFYLIITLLMRRVAKGIGSSGGGGFMSFGKSNAKKYDMEKKTGITFEDVAGQEEAKESLHEIVDFLHKPDKYTKIGALQPKGALLVGPPGTGKTLLAKAVAGEANVAFFSLSGSEFVEMYVGVGASRVRDLFKQAHNNAPCIIFIDEIDAIGKSRDSKYGGGNDEREQTLNQLLSEMDGFDTSKGIMILAATNRPEILDKALLRPGRFDRRVIVEKPDLSGRENILKVHAKKVKMGADVDLKKIALATSGAAGADLANMINEAALRAVRFDRDVVMQEDLMEAVEVVIAGKEKKDRILSPKEKRLVAFHEIGHALVAALQKNSQPVQKITIVPRTMGALGYVMTMPEEEKFLEEKNEILARIVMTLGGRAAEEIVFNTQTTGASNDIEKATKMARSMVTQYGMSEKFGLMGLESIENRYLDGRPVLNVSDVTGSEIDTEVKNILKECYDKAQKLLRDNLKALNSISEFLIDKETLTGEEFMKILKEYVNFDDINVETANNENNDISLA